MATKLTKNFTLEELYTSATANRKGINNSPPESMMEHIKELAELLQKIRDKYGYPIHVNSGYRCLALNNAVGGSKTSQHVIGQAADIVATGGRTNAHLFNVIKEMIDSGEIQVGQLIWEYGTKQEPNWVHVSLPYSKVNNILYFYNKK